MAKILIIDDDVDFCRIAGDFLRRHEHEVIAVHSGSQGLAAVANSPDLILCDLDMPGIDGHGVVKFLRQDRKYSHTPLVFISGCSKRSEIRQSMNLGGDDFIPKPAELLEILDTVNARLVMAENRRRRESEQLKQTVAYFVNIINDLDKKALPVRFCEKQNKNTGLGDLDVAGEIQSWMTDNPELGYVESVSKLDSVLVNNGNRVEYLHLSQVKAIVASGEYSTLLWGDGHRFMLRKAVKKWAEELPKTVFFRIHRGAIINMKFFKHMERDDQGKRFVHLHGLDTVFPVSQRARASFNNFLKEHQPNLKTAK